MAKRTYRASMGSRDRDASFENTLAEIIAKYTELKQLTASILVRRNDAAGQLEEARQRFVATSDRLATALARNDDDAALTLVEKKRAATERVQAMIAELETAETDAGDAKALLGTMRDDIERLKSQRHKLAMAAVGAELREQIEGLSVDAEMIALDNARAHIKNTLAEVELNRELAATDSGREVATRSGKDREEAARAQLEELKKARKGGDSDVTRPDRPRKKM